MNVSTNVAELKEFEPGVLIRIDDVMTGIRKLARVTEAGCAYVDLDTADCTPLPIYASLKPEDAGNMLGWGLFLVDNKPKLLVEWKTLCERLVNSGEGVLVYNRAALWAFERLSFDPEQALAAARAETATITAGRKALDDMAHNAQGVS